LAGHKKTIACPTVSPALGQSQQYGN